MFPENHGQKTQNTELSAERNEKRSQFSGQDFTHLTFKIALIKMPKHLQIEVIQNISRLQQEILVTLLSGPQSARGLTKIVKSYMKTSRFSVTEELNDLNDFGFVEKRKGRGKNYRLTGKLIPYLTAGLSEAMEHHLRQ